MKYTRSQTETIQPPYLQYLRCLANLLHSICTIQSNLFPQWESRKNILIIKKHTTNSSTSVGAVDQLSLVVNGRQRKLSPDLVLCHPLWLHVDKVQFDVVLVLHCVQVETTWNFTEELQANPRKKFRVSLFPMLGKKSDPQWRHYSLNRSCTE